MSEWKTVRLGDVCEKGASNITQNEIVDNFGEYPIYGAAGFIKNVDFYKQEEAYIGIVKDGAGVGRISIHPAKSSLIGTMQYIFPNENIDIKFLASFLKYQNLGRFYTGATIPHIYFKDYKNIKLKLPPLETQKHIAAVLDKCTSLISKYKQILKKYDTLIKSRFIEMFGDPTTNPMNWDTVNISSLLTANASNGFFAKRDEYTEDGNVEVLGVVNIVNTMYSRIDLLPKTNASEKDIKKYSVKYGDMLFCRSSLVAEGIGKASIVPENINKTILFECHVIRLRLDLNKCVPEYMQMLSTTSFFRNQVLKHAKTSTMTTIGQDGILKTDVRLPPIEKQKQFLSFIKQIDKSKFEYIYTGVAA